MKLELKGTEEEIKNYKIGVQKLEDLFSDFNKNVCSDCKRAKEKSRMNAEVSNAGRPFGFPKILELGIEHMFATKECGCCSSCAESSGFFYEPEDGIVINIVDSLYRKNPIYGYFDPYKQKCNLSRGLRSKTCLCYCCDEELSDKASKVFNMYLEPIRKKNPFISFRNIGNSLTTRGYV